MKTKKSPERLCLGCRESHPKRELLRIVRSPEGEYAVDLTGKKPGRGAYICPKLSCLEAVRKNHGLERSFRGQVAPEVYQSLAQALADLSQAGGTEAQC